MMIPRPFWVVIPITTTASGQASGMYQVDSGLKFTIQRIMQKTAQTTDVLEIKDNRGVHYGNLGQDKPMDIQVFTDVASDNNVPANLPTPIIIESNGSLTFTLLDTSATGGECFIYLFGVLELSIK